MHAVVGKNFLFSSSLWFLDENQKLYSLQSVLNDFIFILNLTFNVINKIATLPVLIPLFHLLDPNFPFSLCPNLSIQITTDNWIHRNDCKGSLLEWSCRRASILLSNSIIEYNHSSFRLTWLIQIHEYMYTRRYVLVMFIIQVRSGEYYS